MSTYHIYYKKKKNLIYFLTKIFLFILKIINIFYKTKNFIRKIYLK